MKQICLFIAGLILSPVLDAQTTNDYRSISSGSWSNASIWERFNGSTWVSAGTAPNFTSEKITVRSPHQISVSNITLDQLVIDSGAIINQTGLVIIADGSGTDLLIKGEWNLNSGGNFLGPGSIEVDGVFRVNSGSIGGPTYMSPAYTRMNVNSHGTLIFTTSGQKTIDRAQISNHGNALWNSGDLILNTQNTDTARFINLGIFTISGGTLNMFGNIGRYINDTAGTIIKTGTGTCTPQQGLLVTSFGPIHVAEGTFAANNQNTSVHVYGAIEIDSGAQFLSNWNLSLFSGAIIKGRGNFNINGGTRFVGNCYADSGVTVNLNNGNLFGPGTFFIRTRMNWNGGAIGYYLATNPFRVEIETNGQLFIQNSAQKIIEKAELHNYGTTSWSAGDLVLNSFGTDTAKFINRGSFQFLAGTRNIFGNNGVFHNDVTGICEKNSTGTVTPQQGTRFVNSGILRIENGVFSTGNQNASFHHYGRIEIFDPGIFQAIWNNNFYAGSTVSGPGTLDLLGYLHVTGSSLFDSTSILALKGGYISGRGPLLIQGKMLWTAGAIGDYWAEKAVVHVLPSGVLELNGTAIKHLAKSELLNEGTIYWNQGDWSLSSTVGSDTCIFWNDGTCFVGSSAGNWNGQDNTHIRNLSGGSIVKNSVTNTQVQSNIRFLNKGLIEGVGTFTLNGPFMSSGTISPGLSPGILEINGQAPLSTNSTLYIELLDSNIEGIGHDLLTRNGSLNLQGKLQVVETGIIPNGDYVIIRLGSGTISGAFDSLELPEDYTLKTTSNTAYLTKYKVIQNDLSVNVCAPNGFLFKDTMRYESGNFYDTLRSFHGFDSVVIVRLTVFPEIKNSFQINVCDSFVWNNITYTQSGSFNQNFIASNGCDSLVTLVLNLNYSSSSALNIRSCKNYTTPSGKLLRGSGLFFDTISNYVGCDSLITIQLQIFNADTSLSVEKNRLIANADSGSYQWVRCNNGLKIMTGENLKSFTPKENGSYALIITQNACSDTSCCFSVTAPLPKGLRIYPQPVSDILTIEIPDMSEPATLRIYDAAGRLVDERQAT